MQRTAPFAVGRAEVLIRHPRSLPALPALLALLALVAVALGMVWIAGAVALQTPGARVLRKEIQRIGNVAVLYRPSTDKRQIVLPRP